MHIEKKNKETPITYEDLGAFLFVAACCGIVMVISFWFGMRHAFNLQDSSIGYSSQPMCVQQVGVIAH